ncbi:MAG: flagellar hook basal-body protein [Planctomycetaceae bacterium]|nr:flagellar hook basal-body protein [Planctomycetaceae bacterium]
MLTGLYSASSAMNSAAQRHDVIAHNLAHASHPGFRRHVPVNGTFESALMGDSADPEADPPLSTLGTSSAPDVIDFTPGPLIRTNRPLDFALQGDGFFVVENNEGNRYYTRNGTFSLNPDGRLVTADGLQVSGGNGPIEFPPETNLSKLKVTPDGRIMSGTNVLGKLEVAKFQDNSVLKPFGISLFEAPADVAPERGEAQIVQRSREGSNVSPIVEMVRMIDGMRQYEAAANALKAITEAVQRNVGSPGR